MRVVLESIAPGFEAFVPGRRAVLRFSESERRALQRAATIAEEARELWRASVVYNVDDEGLDTELAMIGIAVDEVVDGFTIDEGVMP